MPLNWQKEIGYRFQKIVRGEDVKPTKSFKEYKGHKKGHKPKGHKLKRQKDKLKKATNSKRP